MISREEKQLQRNRLKEIQNIARVAEETFSLTRRGNPVQQLCEEHPAEIREVICCINPLKARLLRLFGAICDLFIDLFPEEAESALERRLLEVQSKRCPLIHV